MEDIAILGSGAPIHDLWVWSGICVGGHPHHFSWGSEGQLLTKDVAG